MPGRAIRIRVHSPIDGRSCERPRRRTENWVTGLSPWRKVENFLSLPQDGLFHNPVAVERCDLAEDKITPDPKKVEVIPPFTIRELWKSKLGKIGIGTFGVGSVKGLYDAVTFALDFRSRSSEAVTWIHALKDIPPWVSPIVIVFGILLMMVDNRRRHQKLLTKYKPTVSETRVEPLLAPPVAPAIDGELYRVVSGGKAASAGMVREIYVLQKREEEFKIDADVLLEFYAVNTSGEKRFVKDFIGTVEIEGKKIQFERQADFDAWEFNDVDYEYCLDLKSEEDHPWDDSQKQPLKPAFKSFPFELDPREPIEGWVHFIAKDVDFMKLSKNPTYKFTFVDSLGEEIPITRASATKRPGHISVCRKGKAGKPPW